MRDEYRLPAGLVWRMRLQLGGMALLWLMIISIPLAIPAALLLNLASSRSGPLSWVLGCIGVLLALAYVGALLWWARSWGRLALGPWGGIGAFFGAFVALLVIPGLIWFVGDVFYATGLWPVGAVFRVGAWLWFGASLIGVWRWIRSGSVEG